MLEKTTMTPVHIITQLNFAVTHHWGTRRWSVSVEVAGTRDVNKGFAWTKRGAMRQVEQMIRIWTMMADGLTKTVVPYE